MCGKAPACEHMHFRVPSSQNVWRILSIMLNRDRPLSLQAALVWGIGRELSAAQAGGQSWWINGVAPSEMPKEVEPPPPARASHHPHPQGHRPLGGRRAPTRGCSALRCARVQTTHHPRGLRECEKAHREFFTLIAHRNGTLWGTMGQVTIKRVSPTSSHFVNTQLGRLPHPTWRRVASGPPIWVKGGRVAAWLANRPVVREEFWNLKNIPDQGVIARKDTAFARR